MTDTLPDVPGMKTTSAFFRAGLIDVAKKGSLDPDALAASISVESMFDPKAENPYSGASGLIQWMPATAALFHTSVEAIRRMSAEEQLPLIAAYFKRVAPKGLGRDDVYLGIFSPAYIGDPDEKVVSTSGHPVYEENKGLDFDHDGVVTVGNIRQVIRSRLAAADQKPRVDASGPLPPGGPGQIPSGGGGGVIGLAIGGALGLWLWLRRRA